MRLPAGSAALSCVGLLALMSLGSFVAGCRPETEEPALPRAERRPDQVIAEFHRTETREGRRLWELTAARGDIYESEHRIDLVRIHVDYYQEDGRPASRLEADSGWVDTRSHDMEARGNVRVENDQGTVLRTTKLAWEEKSGKMRSEEEVEIERAGDRLRGRGFEGDPGLEVFTLRERVSATVSEKELSEEDGKRP